MSVALLNLTDATPTPRLLRRLRDTEYLAESLDEEGVEESDVSALVRSAWRGEARSEARLPPLARLVASCEPADAAARDSVVGGARRAWADAKADSALDGEPLRAAAGSWWTASGARMLDAAAAAAAAATEQTEAEWSRAVVVVADARTAAEDDEREDEVDDVAGDDGARPRGTPDRQPSFVVLQLSEGGGEVSDAYRVAARSVLEVVSNLHVANMDLDGYRKMCGSDVFDAGYRTLRRG